MLVTRERTLEYMDNGEIALVANLVGKLRHIDLILFIDVRRFKRRAVAVVFEILIIAGDSLKIFVRQTITDGIIVLQSIGTHPARRDFDFVIG